jgi:aerobic C4-dicarboxylate transport protein
VPAAGLAIIFGIDRFMSEARSLTNVIGNGIATLVVAGWCGELDHDRLRAELDPKRQQQEQTQEQEQTQDQKQQESR